MRPPIEHTVSAAAAIEHAVSAAAASHVACECKRVCGRSARCAAFKCAASRRAVRLRSNAGEVAGWPRGRASCAVPVDASHLNGWLPTTGPLGVAAPLASVPDASVRAAPLASVP